MPELRLGWLSDDPHQSKWLLVYIKRILHSSSIASAPLDGGEFLAWKIVNPNAPVFILIGQDFLQSAKSILKSRSKDMTV